MASYKESVLSGTSHRHTPKENKNRTISGETLVDNAAGHALLDQSIKALDLEWSIATMPREHGDATSTRTASVSRRRSTRLGLVEKARAGIVGNLSSLGKRGRETMEAGKDGVRGVAQDIQRRATLRTKNGGAEAGVDEPTTKRVRLSEETIRKDASPAPSAAPARRKPKTWLNKGLYVGQDRSFDPRLSEAKNKLKTASKSVSTGKARTILPLPMFGGQRLLDTGRNFRLPYDVYDPLPRGQPKPEEWKKTQKSECESCDTRPR